MRRLRGSQNVRPVNGFKLPGTDTVVPSSTLTAFACQPAVSTPAVYGRDPAGHAAGTVGSALVIVR